MKPINEFKGEYSFLSNFYPCKVEVLGRTYPSAEHAYQALKTNDIQKREEICKAPTAKEAKALGRKLALRPKWDADRTLYMELVVTAKFLQNPDLKKKLLDTGDAELVEGNYWKDKFWGMFQGKGENHLGKILMKVRHDFKVLNSKPKDIKPAKKIENQLYGLYYDGKYLRTYRTLNFVNGAKTQRAKYGDQTDLSKFEVVEYIKK